MSRREMLWNGLQFDNSQARDNMVLPRGIQGVQPQFFGGPAPSLAYPPPHPSNLIQSFNPANNYPMNLPSYAQPYNGATQTAIGGLTYSLPNSTNSVPQYPQYHSSLPQNMPPAPVWPQAFETSVPIPPIHQIPVSQPNQTLYSTRTAPKYPPGLGFSDDANNHQLPAARPRAPTVPPGFGIGPSCASQNISVNVASSLDHSGDPNSSNWSYHPNAAQLPPGFFAHMPVSSGYGPVHLPPTHGQPSQSLFGTVPKVRRPPPGFGYPSPAIPANMEYGARCGSLPLSNNGDVVERLLTPLSLETEISVPYVAALNQASTAKSEAALACDGTEAGKDLDGVDVGDSGNLETAAEEKNKLHLATGSREPAFASSSDRLEEYSGPSTPSDKDEGIFKDGNNSTRDDKANDIDSSASNIQFTPPTSAPSSNISNEISSKGKSGSRAEEESVANEESDSNEDSDFRPDKQSSSGTNDYWFVTRREMAAEIRLLSARLVRLEKKSVRSQEFTIKHQNVIVKVEVTHAEDGASRFNSVTLQERIASAVTGIIASETRQDTGNSDFQASEPRESADRRDTEIPCAVSQTINTKPFCLNSCQSGCNICGVFRDSEGNFHHTSSKKVSQLGVVPAQEKKCEGCWEGCDQCDIPLFDSVDTKWIANPICPTNSWGCNGLGCQPSEGPKNKTNGGKDSGFGPQFQSVDESDECRGWSSGTVVDDKKPAGHVCGNGSWGYCQCKANDKAENKVLSGDDWNSGTVTGGEKPAKCFCGYDLCQGLSMPN